MGKNKQRNATHFGLTRAPVGLGLSGVFQVSSRPRLAPADKKDVSCRRQQRSASGSKTICERPAFKISRGGGGRGGEEGGGGGNGGRGGDGGRGGGDPKLEFNCSIPVFAQGNGLTG